MGTAETPDQALPVVLAIDDEPTNLALLMRTLRGAYQVHGFTDPREALAKAPELRPVLVLTDYRMPGLTGLELLRELRGAGLDFAAMLVTGFADLDELVRAQGEGLLARIVAKPYRPSELRTQVDLAVGLFKIKNRKSSPPPSRAS